MNPNMRIIPFINPATGEKFGEVKMATEKEVAEAHQEMRQNFAVWRRKPVSERVRILRQFQELIIDSLDEITSVINQDTGKSRQDGLIEVMVAADRLHQYYKNASRWLRPRRVPPGMYIFKRYYVEPHPFGVVAILGPWNYPLELCLPSVCSALLAGNTVLLKPSEVAPGTGAMIQGLFARVPELSPYVRVLHGDASVGEMLVSSRPDLIYLTGSTATGRAVTRSAAKNMTPLLTELGGKDPMIVLEDADIEAAAKWGAWGAFYHAGQTCMAIERVYVVESVYDAFVQHVVVEAKKFRPGYSPEIRNPYNTGPISCESQLAIIEDHMKEAVAKGARVLVGGKCHDLTMEPAVVIDVDHSMKLMRDETFGPILPIMKVKDEDEAIAMANDSPYGLSACVWSGDLDRAQRVARRLEVGSVNINDTMSHYAVSLLPFGGVKDSGNARTHGKQEVLQFTQLRSYAVGRPPFTLDLATRMRDPGNYRLGAAVLRLAFGVTPRQRLQPVVEAVEAIEWHAVKPKLGKMATALGLAAATAAFLFGLLRWRR